MTKQTPIERAVEATKRYFSLGKTKDIHFRKRMLQRLKSTLKQEEATIYAALRQDLNKSETESYMTEVALLYSEIDAMLTSLSKWQKPKLVRASMPQMPAVVKIYREPYGVVLILSPWNYPIQLSFMPLIGAIAGGNTIILKPSHQSPNVAKVIHGICQRSFPRGFVECVMEDGLNFHEQLLSHPFDYIFFTGSPRIGKIVMQSAAKYLTPVTLELGGKSPVFVDKDVDIKRASKRIAYGKLLNAGQTCIAPDHVYVHESIAEDFIDALKKTYQAMIPNDTYRRQNYPKIINEKHYNRLKNLLACTHTCYGGHCHDEECWIEPTIAYPVSEEDGIMQEEIFGPILPILTFNNFYHLIDRFQEKPKPLAAYLFTKNDKLKKYFAHNFSFGGGCINDCLMHIVGHHAPFGGVGQSGMGSYHGKYSFNTFTHEKTVLHKPWLFDNPLRYHPFHWIKDAMIKKLI